MCTLTRYVFSISVAIWLTSDPFHPPNVTYPPEMTASFINQNCGNNDRFKYLAYTITYCFICPVGFLCNSLALVVFFCFIPKSASTVFMINLSFSDVSFSLTLPFRLAYYLQDGQWDFPDWLCRCCVFSFYLNLYTSVLFLTGLSVLRYFAVLHPMHSKILVTVRRACWVCVGIWVLVALSSVPFLFSGTHERLGKTRCFEPRGHKTWKLILVLNYIALVLGFLLPFLTILACNSCIIHRLTTQDRKLRRTRVKRQRSVHLTTMVLTTFLVCFLPYHVARTAHLHAVVLQDSSKPQNCWLTELLQKILVITLCLATSNSCFNPLLYYFSGETFRKAVCAASLRSSYSSFNQGSLHALRGKSKPPHLSAMVKDEDLIQENNNILNRAEQL